MEGWIKLHRQIKEHWLWKSDNRLKWWIDILLTVNHNDTKVLIKGTLIDCKRGQSIRSLESWAKEWNVSKGAVRDFFKLLESDQMMTTESLQITTRITVCKYEDYQDQLNDKETQKKRKGNAKETLGLPKQECKEGEECKEDILNKYQSDFFNSLIPFVDEFGKDTCRDFYNYWSEPNRSKTKIKWQLEETWDLNKRLTRWSNNNFKKPNAKTNNSNSRGKLAGTYKAAENFAREIEEKNRNFVSSMSKSI
jgi:hypothetical protein